MDPQIIWYLLPGFVLAVILALSRKTAMPAPQRIEEWAKRNQFKLVSAQRRWFFTGPFMQFKSAGGPVFRIVVRNPKEELGEGWLCLHSFFGKHREEVKWIRKPDHNKEPSPEPAPSSGVTLDRFSRWFLGVLPALVLLLWGLASLASGRLVIPSLLLRGRDIDAVIEGNSALLFAVAMISFGVFVHIHVFWGRGNPYQHTSASARVFAFIGGACLILGLFVYVFEFVVG